MDAKLVVVSGEAPAGEYDLRLPAIVGRSRTADIKLAHPLVSRKHCEIFESDGQLAVRDLGSLNGTFVGEERISEAILLPPGAMVTIGAVTFQAVYGDMASQLVSEADTSELPDFMAAPGIPASATAAPIEQTIEMSEMDAAESPITEPAEAGRDAGFDFGWLEEPAEDDNDALPQTDPVADESAEIEVIAEGAQEPEEELDLPDPSDAEQNGAADEVSDFAPPAEQPAGGGEDDDLSDFFASIK